MKVTDSLDECISLIRQAKKQKEACSIGYRGNVVDLWYELNYTQSMSEMRVIDVWNLKKNQWNAMWYTKKGGYVLK